MILCFFRESIIFRTIFPKRLNPGFWPGFGMRGLARAEWSASPLVAYHCSGILREYLFACCIFGDSPKEQHGAIEVFSRVAKIDCEHLLVPLCCVPMYQLIRSCTQVLFYTTIPLFSSLLKKKLSEYNYCVIFL